MTRMRRTVISMLAHHSYAICKIERTHKFVYGKSSIHRFFTLVSCLLALMAFCSSTLLCHASETGAAAAPAKEGIGMQKDAAGSKNGHGLSADKTQIDFGVPEQGTPVTGQNITLTNNGTEDLTLLWYEFDYYNCISVDAPDNSSLSQGESCTFTVEADTSLAPGFYNSFLLFSDTADPYFESGIQVNITLEIRETAPTAPVVTSVSISPGTCVASKGSTCAFTASVTGENAYSREVVWSVSGQKSRSTFIDENGILTVASDETASSLVVKAVSKQDSRYSASSLVSLQKSSCFVQVKASPDNGGTVYGSRIVEEGGSAVISAAPHNGFLFEGWFLDGSKVSRNAQLNVNNIRNDRTYTAVFQPVSCRINVHVNNTNAGTTTESRTIGYGDSITLEAAAKDGYRFDYWLENGVIVSTDAKLQLNKVTQSRDLTAVFSQNKFHLTLNCSPADTGTVSGAGTYDIGNNIKITADPIQGYRFIGWVENGAIISKEREYSINNITRDMCLTANFEKKTAVTYVVAASVTSSNGSITPEGRTTVAEGSGILYSIVPKSGYTISAVYVDGNPIGAVSSYSFTDIKDNHTIVADFAALPRQESNNTKPDRTESSGNAAGSATGSSVSSEKVPEPESDTKPVQPPSSVETDPLSGTLLYLNTSVEEASRLIDEHNDRELMMGALETGDLQVTIHNDFADDVQETSSASFYENSSVTNFETVLDHLLSREDKITMLLGKNPVTLNFHIECIDDEAPQDTMTLFEENKMPGMQIGQYFEVSLLESRQNDTNIITELPTTLQVVMKLPDDLRAENRRFYVLRLHTNEDGSQKYTELADEDKNPDTITFSTDRFSPYAIAYIDLPSSGSALPEITADAADSRSPMTAVIIVLLILLTATVGGMLLLLITKRKGT